MDQAPSKPRKPGTFVKGHPGYKPKGALNKINRTTKEALDEAANIIGGKAGKVGVFVKVGEKDIVALGHMLARSMPMEVAAEINNVGSIREVNIISLASGLFVTEEDGVYITEDAARRLGCWGSSGLPKPAIGNIINPAARPEPEVQALMERVSKRKPDDDMA